MGRRRQRRFGSRSELMIPKDNFQSPGGLVTRSYCATSGLLTSDLCSSVGLAASDLYDADYAPTKTDDSLVSGNFVRVKGNLVQAGPNTPKSSFLTAAESHSARNFEGEWIHKPCRITGIDSE